MSYRRNSTRDYHLSKLDTLGWELTVCNMLAPEDSPCRRVLAAPGSYGELLYVFLKSRIPMDGLKSVIEVGGGYGHLMAAFLKKNPDLRPVMLDLSPALLGAQRKALHGTAARFIQADFFEADPSILAGMELALFNENLGDFPTLCGLTCEALAAAPGSGDLELRKAALTIERYGLELPEDAVFNFNSGAAEAMEILCAAGIPFLFLSEHSCEARAPEDLSRFIPLIPSGNPERIALKGHDEYTIRFSHLERIARLHGYGVHRGPFADFLRPVITEEVRFILSSGVSSKDEHEIIRQFIEDCYKYEYLLAVKTFT